MRKITNAELQRPDAAAFRSYAKAPVALVLDNVRSALNVGSVFRTADAFAVEQMVLCGITAAPPHREIQKTALGATESISWKHVGTTRNALVELKRDNFTVVGIEQLHEGIFLNAFRPVSNQRYAFVFGNEVNGISDGRYDGLELQFLFGYLFAPIAWLIGVPAVDMLAMGQLLGEKTVINEFVAYISLGDMLKNDLIKDPKTTLMATYALSGFANFASIGIQIGGIGALAPNQRKNLSELGLKALVGGTIACLMTAVFSGMLYG